VGEELDTRDKELLRNMDRFNQTYAAAGWHLQGRDITQNLSRILLLHSSLTSSRLLHTDLDGARVVDTQFTDVEFQQVKFTNASLDRVVFTNCKFLMTSFQNSRLTNCRFVNCESNDLNAQKASASDCQFESFNDTSGVYDGAAFTTCDFDGCHMYNSSFFGTTLNRVAIRRSMLKYVVYSEIKGSDLIFEEDMLDNCGLGKSNFGTLTIRGGQNKGLTLKLFHAGMVSVERCANADGLTVQESNWEKASIVDCAMISELTINQSHVNNFVIERNQIAYFEMKMTKVVGKSRIADCTIEGLGLDNSNLIGLEMTNCRITRYLTLDDATVDAVVLNQIAYAPDLRFSAQGIKYLNGSAQFGR
jgi:fluoroquinolone resistance protein